MLLLVTLFLFVFWPFAAVVPVFVGIYRRYKWAYFCLALWLALYSVYFIPSGDQFRFYQIFTEFPEVNWELFDSQPLHYYSLVYVVMYAVRELGFHFEIVRLLWVLGGYSLYFAIWIDSRDCDGVEATSTQEFLLFLCYLFSISLFDLALGFRSAMACAFAVAACYCFYFKKKLLRALVLAVFATMIHFQFAVVFVALIWLAFGKLEKRQLLLGVLLSYFCGEWLFSGILASVLDDSSGEVSYLSEYVSDDGFWKAGVVETYSGIHLLFDYFLKAAKIAVVITYIAVGDKCKNACRESWSHLVYAMILVWALTFSYVTISGRVFMFVVLLMVIDIAKSWRRELRLGSMMVLLGLLSFLYTVNWASWRKHRAYSDEVHFLYDNIFRMLTKNYDDNFINANIDDGGHLIGEGAPK